MNTITLTNNEKQVLLQLIDLAVKAGGLNVAEAAIVLTKKINLSPPDQEDSPQPTSE